MGDCRIGVLTCSDTKSRPGMRDDVGHRIIADCEGRDWLVVAYHVSPDDMESITSSLIDMCDAEEADAVVTIGGTGLGLRDVTPEATERVCERMVPGIAEAIRRLNSEDDPAQMLSRAVSGMRGKTLVVNLPGAKEPALKSFAFLAEILGSAVDIMCQGEFD